MKKKLLLVLSLSSLLLAPMMLAGFSSDQKIVKAEDSEKLISIDKTCVKVGTPLKITTSLPSLKEYTFKWFIDGEEIPFTSKDFTPSFETLESWVEVRLMKNDAAIAKDRVYISNLPVVYINTKEDLPVTSRDEYIDAKMIIQGNQKEASSFEGDIEIKGRGTSSWHYDKKPFKLKLKKKASLFNYGKSKHYVLLANYLDPSCIRNTIASEASRALGLANSQMTNVDVIFNDEFQGNYQLAEHIRIGSNIVDIFDWEDMADDLADALIEKFPEYEADKDLLEEELETNLFWAEDEEYRVFVDDRLIRPRDYIDIPEINGGFLFEISNSVVDEKTYFQTNKGIDVCINKPENANKSLAMRNFAQDYFNDYEEALYSYDGYNSKGVHYSELADMESMINYWLVNEILANEDAAGRSRYAYIPLNGKLTFGPTWDFDISSGSYRALRTPYDWAITGTINGLGINQDFYKEFVDDPYFQIRAQERYWFIRDYLDQIVRSDGFITTIEENIYESLIANENKWLNEGEFVQRSSTGTAGDVAKYKDFLIKRLSWLDEVFDSEDSINEALYMNCSAHPNKKSENIKIECSSLEKDTAAHGSDYLLKEDNNLVINVASDIHDLNLYVNGIKYLENIETGKDIEIPLDLLNNDDYDKNIIYVANENESNFVTVRKDIPEHYFENHDSNTDFMLNDCKPKDHTLIKINKGTKVRNLYEISEDCYYCTTCHHYYKYSNGKNIIYKKDLLMSTKRQDIKEEPVEPQITNKKADYKLLFIISVSISGLLAVSLVTTLVLFKLKLKK